MNLYDPIKGDETKPKDMSNTNCKKMHREGIRHIKQLVDDIIFHHVSN